MSTGHVCTAVTADTPHGPVTVGVTVAWVRCDRCGHREALAHDGRTAPEEAVALTLSTTWWREHGTAGHRCLDCAEGGSRG